VVARRWSRVTQWWSGGGKGSFERWLNGGLVVGRGVHGAGGILPFLPPPHTPAGA
jgi:hypothetical protein